MASEVPLVLQSCDFENIKFMCSTGISEVQIMVTDFLSLLIAVF
jgi:hypothetical protein